jgi:hypothetical protein
MLVARWNNHGADAMASPFLRSLSPSLSLSLSLSHLWYLSSLTPAGMENHIPNLENLISQTEALGREDPSPQLSPMAT